MVDYSIAAIPTEYKGRIYRSRLEARWAAFFDRLDLAAEYEPFDLGSWSPDFLLSAIDTLIEVKPLTAFDPDTWSKIISACIEQKLKKAIVLTTVAPILDRGVAWIGWAGMPWSTPTPGAYLRAGIAWYGHESQPTFVADITCISSDGFFSTSGAELLFRDFSLRTAADAPASYGEYTMELWARATSDVQWHAKDAESDLS
jgi:hypothetical protein